ncbi:MAG TPA: polyprenyl diphosphate synthase [Longimicrobiales bacterium]
MEGSKSAGAPRHTAIIMDGNGRWAQARGLPRSAGHREGAKAVRRVIESAPLLGITALTLYAFSADNWRRPRAEVQTLMRLLRTYLRDETARCIAEGVRLEVIGRRDRLSPALRVAIAAAERATSAGRTLDLRLAIDYSARDAIVRGDASLPDVDLLIRTGGEQRLSDFLLRECAYAELYFTPCAWPDFDGAALAAAVAEFGRRQRRFGGLAAVAS